METKISVVIVCYNGENYLEHALSAICRQTYNNYEIIFIDDASTDSSLKIAKSVLDSSSIPHKLIHFENNKGLANGRTEGIRISSGDYLIFNDHDDYMADNCLEVLAKYAVKGYDKVFSSITYIDKDSKIIGKSIFTNKTSKWIIPHLQGVLLKKSLFTDNGIDFPSEILMDDVVACGKINLFSEKPIGISDNLYYMRIHDESMTHVISWTPKSTEYLDTALFSLTKFSEHIQYADVNRYFEYYCMRCYYSIVMHCRKESYKEKKEHYNRTAHVLIRYFPDYLSNPIIRKLNNPEFDVFHKRIQILVRAEKFDQKVNSRFFMYSILFGYHVLDRMGVYKHA